MQSITIEVPESSSENIPEIFQKAICEPLTKLWLSVRVAPGSQHKDFAFIYQEMIEDPNEVAWGTIWGINQFPNEVAKITFRFLMPNNFEMFIYSKDGSSNQTSLSWKEGIKFILNFSRVEMERFNGMLETMEKINKALRCLG